MRALAILLLFAAIIAAAPPKKMLWSWSSPDDFRFLKSSDFGVAYLALSIHFAGQDPVSPSPRAIPVRIGPTTWQTAVIRFDFDSYGSRRPAFTEQQRKDAVQMIVEIAELSRAQGIQIDFDAPHSAYPFYRHLLADVRGRLGPKVFLSITALVSWCDSEQSWLTGLQVDEIVPMAFYMGQSTPAVITLLQSGGQFRFPGCRNSIGVQFGGYDESIRPHKAQRAYFFSEKAWTMETVRAAERTIQP
jgi:hypothetical protein